ncbi:hypothetical protein ACFSTC_22500 [Nonomuraea ferruginea]
MPTFEEITTFITEKPLATAVIALLSLAGLILAFLVLRVAWRVTAWLFARYVANRPIEDVLTIVAASIATGVSAQGMWRFSGDVLGLDGPLRLLLFAFIEVAIITSAVRARRNMRENFSAGIDGIAVWALTCLTAVLSSMDASSFPEAVFRLAAPLVAAWLWERGMAIERHRIRGTGRINWRLTPERLLVRLGLAEVSDRTASEVDAHRRLTRVALAAKRAKALREAGAPRPQDARRPGQARQGHGPGGRAHRPGRRPGPPGGAARPDRRPLQHHRAHRRRPSGAVGARARPPSGARQARAAARARRAGAGGGRRGDRGHRRGPADRRHRPARGAHAPGPRLLEPADRQGDRAAHRGHRPGDRHPGARRPRVARAVEAGARGPRPHRAALPPARHRRHRRVPGHRRRRPGAREVLKGPDQPSAAETSDRASSCTLARWSGPRNDSA